MLDPTNMIIQGDINQAQSIEESENQNVSKTDQQVVSTGPKKVNIEGSFELQEKIQKNMDPKLNVASGFGSVNDVLAPQKEAKISQMPKAPVVPGNSIVNELEKEEVKTDSKQDLSAILGKLALKDPEVGESTLGDIYGFINKAVTEGVSFDKEAALNIRLSQILPSLSDEQLQHLSDFVYSDQYNQIIKDLKAYRDNFEENTGLTKDNPIYHHCYREVYSVTTFFYWLEQNVSDVIKNKPNIISMKGVDMYLDIKGEKRPEPRKFDPKEINTALASSLDVVKEKLDDDVEKNESTAIHQGIWLLSAEEVDMDALQFAVDSYFGKQSPICLSTGVTGIPFDCYKCISADKRAAVKAKADQILAAAPDLQKTNKKLFLFLRDVSFKIDFATRREANEAAAKEVINGNPAAFQKTELGWSFWHWLKNLFTFSKPTYSLTDNAFRESVRSFAKGISFESHQLLDEKFQGRPIIERVVPDYISEAIKAANPGMSDAEVQKYQNYALEIFEEEHRNWQTENKYTFDLSPEELLKTVDEVKIKEKIGNANWDLYSSVRSFVESVFDRKEKELEAKINEVLKFYKDDNIGSLTSVINVLPFNTRKKVIYQMANVQEIKDSLEQLASKEENDQAKKFLKKFVDEIGTSFSDGYFVRKEIKKLKF